MTPFSKVALEIGGNVETYWKSTAGPALDLLAPQAGAPTSSRATSITSPDFRTPFPTANAIAPNMVTLSSLSGEFVHIVVQVTRDGVPVVFPDWNIPVDDDQFDLGVADVSAVQFSRLSNSLGRQLDMNNLASVPTSAAAWHGFLAQRMATLKDVLKVIPFQRTFFEKDSLTHTLVDPSFHVWCQS